MQLEILMSLLAPKSSKVEIPSSQGKKGKKTFWKPNSSEAREGIIIHVKVQLFCIIKEV